MDDDGGGDDEEGGFGKSEECFVSSSSTTTNTEENEAIVATKNEFNEDGGDCGGGPLYRLFARHYGPNLLRPCVRLLVVFLYIIIFKLNFYFLLLF